MNPIHTTKSRLLGFYAFCLGLSLLGLLFHTYRPLFLFSVATIYILPSVVASGLSHPHTASIIVINLGLGWTIIGWVGALAWAVLPVKR
jgi:hypothetical protein